MGSYGISADFFASYISEEERKEAEQILDALYAEYIADIETAYELGNTLSQYQLGSTGSEAQTYSPEQNTLSGVLLEQTGNCTAYMQRNLALAQRWIREHQAQDAQVEIAHEGVDNAGIGHTYAVIREGDKLYRMDTTKQTFAVAKGIDFEPGGKFQHVALVPPSAVLISELGDTFENTETHVPLNATAPDSIPTHDTSSEKKSIRINLAHEPKPTGEDGVDMGAREIEEVPTSPSERIEQIFDDIGGAETNDDAVDTDDEQKHTNTDAALLELEVALQTKEGQALLTAKPELKKHALKVAITSDNPAILAAIEQATLGTKEPTQSQHWWFMQSEELPIRLAQVSDAASIEERKRFKQLQSIHEKKRTEEQQKEFLELRKKFGRIDHIERTIEASWLTLEAQIGSFLRTQKQASVAEVNNRIDELVRDMPILKSLIEQHKSAHADSASQHATPGSKLVHDAIMEYASQEDTEAPEGNSTEEYTLEYAKKHDVFQVFPLEVVQEIDHNLLSNVSIQSIAEIIQGFDQDGTIPQQFRIPPSRVKTLIQELTKEQIRVPNINLVNADITALPEELLDILPEDESALTIALPYGVNDISILEGLLHNKINLICIGSTPDTTNVSGIEHIHNIVLETELTSKRSTADIQKIAKKIISMLRDEVAESITFDLSVLSETLEEDKNDLLRDQLTQVANELVKGTARMTDKHVNVKKTEYTITLTSN